MKTLATSFLALIMLGATALVLAHDDATLDKAQAPNGGQLRMAGPYHLELVVEKDDKGAKSRPVLVYVTDHANNPVDTKGASGSVTLLAGKTKSTAMLSPDGDNRLKGDASYAWDASLKAIVTVTLPGAAAQQARFAPGARAAH